MSELYTQRFGRALRKPISAIALELDMKSANRRQWKLDKRRADYQSGKTWRDAPWHVFICTIHIGSYGSRSEAVKRVRQNYNQNARAEALVRNPTEEWQTHWWATITYDPNGPDGKL